MIEGKKVLVVSAHAADYVWRAGGTIAKYIKHGAEVHVVVLSFGVRGESNDLWKQEGATYIAIQVTAWTAQTPRRGCKSKSPAGCGVKRLSSSPWRGMGGSSGERCWAATPWVLTRHI